MTSTPRFVNASGLPPDGEQITTARDMAILSRAVMRDYPQYYSYFGLRSIDFHGKVLMNHNHLVGRTPGVDGMKTGYTALAGFNLVASGVRDGHRLITVVLGGPSVAARDHNVEDLLNAGFAVINNRARGQRLTVASLIASPDDMSGPVTRAPVEMGSADQTNLQVEVQPQMRTLPTLEAAKSLAAPPEPSHEAAKAAPSCAQGRHGRHHRGRAEACAAPAVARASAPRPAETRTARIEAAEEKQDEAVAKTCATRRHHRRSAACDVDTQTADAAPKAAGKLARADTTKSNGGGYMIQVGAYKNHALAAGQIEKVSPLVAGAGKVEEAGGNYRARFFGLSQKQAKAACHALSAKGQACMVMASS